MTVKDPRISRLQQRDIPLIQGRLTSRDLFRDGQEVLIIHDQQEYKLRLTGNGKLILTK